MKNLDNLKNVKWTDKATANLNIPTQTCGISTQEIKDVINRLNLIYQILLGKANIKDLAAVATSGSYKDLIDVPSFKTINNLSILGNGNINVEGSGNFKEIDPEFKSSPAYTITSEDIKNWNEKYHKPESGISSTDLSRDLQEAIEKIALAITQETDPTVPNWAKNPNKPAYTALEVGALPENTFIPSKVSDLQNDLNFAKEDNIIKGIKVNNSLANIKNGIAEISVPTALSNLTDDLTHRLVTDSEKSAWNSKISGIKVNGVILTPSNGVVNVPVSLTNINNIIVNGEDHYADTEGNFDLGTISGGSYDLTQLENTVRSLLSLLEQLLILINSQAGTVDYAVGEGTFDLAYRKSQQEGFSTKLFTWLLKDVDDDETHVNKLIYHIGNGRFIDSIGAEINGRLEGLTFTTNGPGAYLALANTTTSKLDVVILLPTGRSNYTFEDLSNIITAQGKTPSEYIQLSSQGDIFTITGLRILSREKNDSNQYYNITDQAVRSQVVDDAVNISCGTAIDTTHLVAVDFGGNIVDNGYGLFCGQQNLLSVYGLQCKNSGNYKYMFAASSIVNIEMFGSVTSALFRRTFSGAVNLTHLDISNLTGKPAYAATLQEFLLQLLYKTNVRTIDISKLDLRTNCSWINAFSQSAINTIIVGKNSIPDVQGANGSSVFSGLPKKSVTVIYAGNELPSFNLKKWSEYVAEFKIPKDLKDAYNEDNGNISIVEY